jgi:hypothetical protein
VPWTTTTRVPTRAAGGAALGGVNHDGVPYRPRLYELRNVTGRHDPADATDFRFHVDAGTNVGLGQQVRVSYDLTPTAGAVWSSAPSTPPACSW